MYSMYSFIQAKLAMSEIYRRCTTERDDMWCDVATRYYHDNFQAAICSQLISWVLNCKTSRYHVARCVRVKRQLMFFFEIVE